MPEKQLPPPVGRRSRARLADSASCWLDWTEQNRAIWLATLGRGEDIPDPDIRAVDVGRTPSSEPVDPSRN